MGLLQHIWNGVVDTAGTDPLTYHCFSYMYTQVVFFVVGAIFLYFDLTLSPKSLRKYKSQHKAKEPMDMAKFKVLMKQVIFNSVIVGGAFAYVIFEIWRKYPGTRFTNISTIFLSFFYLFSKSLLNCF
jgi:hypothetical protein